MGFFAQSSSSGVATYDTTAATLSFIGMLSTFYITPTDGQYLDQLSYSWAPGADPDLEQFKVVIGRPATTVHRYFHFRFIPVPAVLNVNNPALNTDIPFYLWNTFPFPDELVSGTILNTTVVTTDLTVGSDIRDFEWVEYHIQIGAGEAEVDADLQGVFSQGSFTLGILGTLIVDMPLIPEEDVSEVWTWSTSITTSYNNTEQRVRLAPGPVRVAEYSYETDETEMVEVARRLYQSTVGLLTVPFYQYQTKLTQDSSPGDTEIFFNPDYTNLRVGDYLYIRNPDDDSLSSGIIQVIESFTPTGCIIEGALGSTIRAGWWVCPAFPMYIEEPSQTFDSVSGTLRMSGRAADRSRPLLRAGATPTLTTFGGLPVIDQRTLAGITEGPLTSTEVFDNTFGSYRKLSTWPYPQFQRSVSYFCPIKKNMAEFDKWMLFFDTIAGSHKPFYLPSTLHDLKVFEQPINLSNHFKIQGTGYSTLYADNPTYQQLQITLVDGTILRCSVAGASPVGGNDEITVNPEFPADIEDRPIAKISYLYRVRLAGDTVNVKFKNNRAYFSFGVVGVAS